MRRRNAFRAPLIVPLTAAAIASLVATAACSSNVTSHSTATATTVHASTASGSITVLAASSLTKGFTALGKEFERVHPGTAVHFDFGSSSELATQIQHGAPADAFASADRGNIDRIVGAHLNRSAPMNFVRNKLSIAVEHGNPKKVQRLADLAKPDLVVVLCDPSVPCGKFAVKALANAKVTVTPKSREASAKATLSKVELGEADAAIVYVSDIAAGKVEGVTIPDDVNVVTTLALVALQDAENPTLAAAWDSFVVAHADELVTTFGFLRL